MHSSIRLSFVLFAFALFLPVSAIAQENLALNKPATQSSEYGDNGAPARLAVDGYKDGNFSVGSVTHTAEPATTDPWWEVDLGQVYEIQRIQVYGRTDCCGERLSNFQIFFRNDESEAWVKQGEIGPLEKQRGRRKPQTEFSMMYNLNDLPTARYVRIQLPGENRILSLAEVEVYGGPVGNAAYANSCERDPGPEEVFIFARPNYLGECRQMQYRDGNYPYSIANEFSDPERFRLSEGVPFYSVKVGSNTIVTICTDKQLKGRCVELREGRPILEGFTRGVQSMKIFTRTPKNYVNPSLPNDNQVTVCQQRTFGGGCRKMDIGNYDFSGVVYRYIHVGANVKAQTYSDTNFYGRSEVYNGGSKQASLGEIKSIRVMRSSDQIAELKPRPTPAPAATPAPVPTPAPVATTAPKPNPPSKPTVDGPLRVKENTLLGLTVRNQQIQSNTPIILHSGFNEWTMLSNGGIVLKDNPRFGLTVKNQNISNGAEIILHEGYNLWTVLSDGAIVLKDNPAFGITVLNQNLTDNAQIILHRGYNTWTSANSNPKTPASRPSAPVSRPAAPPVARHAPPPGGYAFCADEPYRCNFNYIGTVAFGVNGKFKYKTGVVRGIDCNVATFGDPEPGVPKKCYSKFEREWRPNTTPNVSDKPAPPGDGYRVCADEGQSCRFQGTGTVAFGFSPTRGGFKFKSNVTREIRCTAENFGAPATSADRRACYVKVD